MKGGIYPTKYGWQVRFGKITKNFKRYEHTTKPHRDQTPAERFLNGLRYEVDKGTFDYRDYRKDRPLGFSNLATLWLEKKAEKDIKPKTLKGLENTISQACKVWGNRNIKTIGFADIEDFLFSRKDIREKTRANMKSCLNDFWQWLRKRGYLTVDQMPDFPEVSFELGYRNITDIETQQKIINEVGRIADPINPRIKFGVHCLSVYVAIRPSELINIKEKHINLNLGCVLIPNPKEKTPKTIFLLKEDIEFIKDQVRGMPEMYFFRHVKGNGGAKPGQKFGKDYLYKFWKKACSNLGIEGVDLYGGTRHTTVSALGKVLTPEQIKAGTMHATNKAFERYFQRSAEDCLTVYRKVSELTGTNNELITFPGKSEILK
jgi:integrase